EQARELLVRASRVSPLLATARYAFAHPAPGETTPPPLARALGQSRDVVTLTWSGRQLLAAGKKGPALSAYRAALEMAAHVDHGRTTAPTYLDDSQVRRYALPSEDLLGPVIRDMAEQTAWSYKDWAVAIPRRTVAPLVAARVLRERLSPDADAALDAALDDADRPPVGEGLAVAVRTAAQAEALAMKNRWAEADDRYRLAIDRMPVDAVRRSWWFNVAEVAQRLNEDPKRQKALDAAKSTDPKDEITQRAIDLQKASGFIAQRPGPGTGAAPDSGPTTRR
ncbi:MAG: hypothetical protein LC745_06495, partial [Planctomycetia bacterium]|nr:hypothetical protein [Planctomycetia bacterium]